MPGLPRALLLDTLPGGWLEAAQTLGCAAIVAAYALMDAALIKRLHAAGMRALAYTVNDPPKCSASAPSASTASSPTRSTASHRRSAGLESGSSRPRTRA
jgi:hypothetical protein